MSAHPLIQVKGLRKEYLVGHEKISVLRRLDFTMYPGDFTAIMGESGSGKSTMLHILGCLDQPDSGTYILDGMDVSQMSDRKLSSLRNSYIGFVFQSFYLLPEATVYENIALPFLYGKYRPKDIRQNIMRAVNAVSLNHRIHHRPAALSGGERQRVAIARAVAVKPKLILADEPTGNLDVKTGREILDLFSRLHAGGATILLVTHNKAVANVACRILTMEQGNLCYKS